jgi:hypothetical protein
MPDDNHKRHPDRQDRNITGLIEQVAKVARGKKKAIGEDSEDPHNHKQGNEHA